MFRNGKRLSSLPTQTFVLVNQARGTVQVAFNTVYPGPNGIGGVTVDGTVSDMKMSTDKRGNINCNFSIQGIGISAQIFFTLTNGDNNATVTISPNFNSNTMTLSGSLLPLNQSNIFKGRSGKGLLQYIYSQLRCNHLKSVHLQRSFYIIFIMREFIIADNQDITKAGMMFLLSKQKDTALLLEADNKAELIQQLRLHPEAVVIHWIIHCLTLPAPMN